MRQVTRINQGPYPTPRPGEVPMEFEPIKLGLRARVALVGLAGIAAVGGVGFLSNKAIDQIRGDEKIPAEAPPATHEYGENPSGIPTSGAESQ